MVQKAVYNIWSLKVQEKKKLKFSSIKVVFLFSFCRFRFGNFSFLTISNVQAEAKHQLLGCLSARHHNRAPRSKGKDKTVWKMTAGSRRAAAALKSGLKTSVWISECVYASFFLFFPLEVMIWSAWTWWKPEKPPRVTSGKIKVYETC